MFRMLQEVIAQSISYGRLQPPLSILNICKNTKVSTNNIMSITVISLYNKYISSVSGLQYLYFQNTYVTQISFDQKIKNT